MTSVYATLMSSDAYGQTYFYDLALNSDVEFKTFSSNIRSTNGDDFECFDGTQHGSSVRKFWNKAYEGIERANIFIQGIQESAIFDSEDTELTQQLGEAKTLRAMFYHDLVVMYGDIPFSTVPAYELESLIIPVTDRNAVLDTLINDLIEVAPGMTYANELQDGVERVSREFCHGLIARMALTRAGYSLYPNKSSMSDIGTMERQSDYKDYYKIAMDYADSVIVSGTHELNKSFRQVFIDECNNVVVV